MAASHPIHYLSPMFQLLRYTLLILAVSICTPTFAATKAPISIGSTGSVSTESGTITSTGNNRTELIESETGAVSESDALKKDKEKTMNDINTFLIESYKLKIDRILSNLNMSLERVTDNDPVAQAKLLEKIRNDIDTKIQVINSRSISENRKKILSSVFSYIQENLDAKISKLVQDK